MTYPPIHKIIVTIRISKTSATRKPFDIPSNVMIPAAVRMTMLYLSRGLFPIRRNRCRIDMLLPLFTINIYSESSTSTAFSWLTDNIMPRAGGRNPPASDNRHYVRPRSRNIRGSPWRAGQPLRTRRAERTASAAARTGPAAEPDDCLLPPRSRRCCPGQRRLRSRPCPGPRANISRLSGSPERVRWNRRPTMAAVTRKGGDPWRPG